MIVCEYFEREDPNHKGYSLVEIDMYAWIPEGMEMQSHRLSLRKNLITGKFEVYRRYNIITTLNEPDILVQTFVDTKQEEVVCTGDLKNALEVANREDKKYWNSKDVNVVCNHITSSCPRRMAK